MLEPIIAFGDVGKTAIATDSVSEIIEVMESLDTTVGGAGMSISCNAAMEGDWTGVSSLIKT